MASADEASDTSDRRESKDKEGDKNEEGDKDKEGDKDQEGDKKQDKDGETEKPRSKKPLLIVAAIVLVGAIVGFIFWFARRNEVRTDDAYTDGNVVTMAPKVSGYVVALTIDDNVHVHKGDLLLRIDPRDYLAAQRQAQAALELAQAQLKSAQDALRIARVQYPAQLVSARA